MKNKFRIGIPFILIMVLILSFGLSSCGLSGNNGKTPEDLITDAYGNEEFKISFSSETLDEPLEDMTYSANKIPKLPTPQKVGYIFEGWFLDPEFVMPFVDGTLYLAMRDITLFPKWSKEKFIHDGTYDIEFDAVIVDGTLKKGEATDDFGGYRNFCDALIKDECCIEKNGDSLSLKLKFDSGANIVHQSLKNVFEVRVDTKLMGTDIYVEPFTSIDSLADPVKTYNIGINTWDLSSTLYLDIEWTNFENENLTEENRYSTTTSYMVAIDLTKIIGFSQPFVDTSIPLEQGYYLAKSYYRGENNLGSMGNQYNPVYSYIYSDGNENYTLIKQNLPYLGLVARMHPLYPKITDNYYDMMTSFISLMAVYDIDDIREYGEIKSDYYPELYNAGKYRRSVTEFHADTGKIYNVIDIDSDLKREYICLSAVSGYMEREGGMGYMKSLISIDYKTIIKLADVDYEPLEGNHMSYESEFAFYPGGAEDLDERNMTKSGLEENGLSIEMPDFFFGAKNKDDHYSQKIMYDSAVEVMPTKQTDSISVADSRYVIGKFNVQSKIYGVDTRDQNKLFVDKMNPQAFEGKSEINFQVRDVAEVSIGKSCEAGELIDIEKLFNEKVDRRQNFNYVDYKAFEINNGVVDFGKPLKVNGKKFNFTRDIAFEFEYNTQNGKAKTLVKLKNIPEPEIKVIDDKYTWTKGDNYHYEKDGVSNIGSNITYPQVIYNWGEVENCVLVGSFFGEGKDRTSINPAKSAWLAERSGYYKLYNTMTHTDEYKLPEKNMVLMYEINNEFGERKILYFNYLSEARKAYKIMDDDGNIICEEDVKFTGTPPHRKSVYFTYTGNTVYDKFNESHIKNYTHTETNITEDYTLSSYTVSSDQGSLPSKSPSEIPEMLNIINNYLADKSYGCVTFSYYHNSDYLEVNYLYKITFNGVDTYEALTHDAFFTDTPYRFAKMNLIGSDMNVLAKANVGVRKYVDGRPSENTEDINNTYAVDQGGQYQITFKTPGTYRININYEIPAYLIGSSHSKRVTFYQMVVVDSNHCDVEITYITDELHPFKDGELEKTVTYNLGEGIHLMKDDKKGIFEIPDAERNGDPLFAWGLRHDNLGELFKVGFYIKGEDFIHDFNSKKLTLYAIWSVNSTVKVDVNGKMKNAYIYMDYNSNDYVIKMPAVSAIDGPRGTQHIGWTGGICGSGIIKSNKIILPYNTDYYDTEKYADMFDIKAVFKQVFTVRFEISSEYADVRFPSVQVVDGERIKDAYKYLDITCKKPGYKFVGYYITTDPDHTIVDINTLAITSSINLRAEFKKI